MADSQISSRENRKNGAPLSQEERTLRDERRRKAKERNLFEIQHYGGRSFVARCEATRPDFEMLQQLDYFYNLLKGRAGEINGIPFEIAKKYIDQHTGLLLAKSDLCRELAKALGKKYREPQLIGEYREMKAKAERERQLSKKKNGAAPKPGHANITAAPIYDHTGTGDSASIPEEMAISSTPSSAIGHTKEEAAHGGTLVVHSKGIGEEIPPEITA